MDILKGNSLIPRKAFSKWISNYKFDLLILASLVTVVAIAVYSSSYQIPSPIFTDFYAQGCLVW
jgi:hypothetical protein